MINDIIDVRFFIQCFHLEGNFLLIGNPSIKKEWGRSLEFQSNQKEISKLVDENVSKTGGVFIS